MGRRRSLAFYVSHVSVVRLCWRLLFATICVIFLTGLPQQEMDASASGVGPAGRRVRPTSRCLSLSLTPSDSTSQGVATG